MRMLLVPLLAAVVVASVAAEQSLQYAVPGYNIDYRQDTDDWAVLGDWSAAAAAGKGLAKKMAARREVAAQPLASNRKLASWRSVLIDKALATVYGATPTEPQGRLVYVEMGANNGLWTRGMMKAAKEAGMNPLPRCFMFEPQEMFTKNHLKNISLEYGCTVVPNLAWIEAKEFDFNMHVNSQASSILDGGAWVEPGSKVAKVWSVDMVQWFIANTKPTDNLYVRMDIEGAEYAVLRYLILHGIACWWDTLELELHALHHKSNYNKRPADAVLPWLLKGCGVDVKREVWYPPEYFDLQGDPACSTCTMLSHDHDLDAVYNREGDVGHWGTVPAAAAGRL